MIHVAHLFNPKHAPKALHALKRFKWSQLEYAAFLERVAAHSSPDNLAPNVLKALWNYLPQVKNPIVRQVCIDKLVSLGAFDSRHECCASFIATECFEEASKYLDLQSSTSDALIAYGGADIVYEFSRTNGSLPGLWSRLFEAFVDIENYEKAKELWQSHDRPAFKAIGEHKLLKFVELIGRYRDRAMLQQFLRSSSSEELTLTSGAVAACLNCFGDDPQLWTLIAENDDILRSVLILQDGRFISDALARRPLELLTHMRTNQRKPQVLGNLLLQGIYRQNSSRSVLHAYRILVDDIGLEPNMDTAQILANAAYRLGNSKILAHEVWKEMAERRIRPTRKFLETIIMCQLVGTGYSSALFFISEMFRQGVQLRSHIQRIIFNKFERLGSSSPLVELFSQRRPEQLYPKFDVNTAETESLSLGLSQAQANANVFLYRQNPETAPLVELQSMLAFDKLKAEPIEKQ